MDTMLAHKAVYPGGKGDDEEQKDRVAAATLPHDLAYLASVYTWHPYWKDDRVLAELVGEEPKADEYSIKDSCVNLEMVEPITKELIKHDLVEFFFSREMTKVWASVNQSLKGLPILTDVREGLRASTEKSVSDLEEQLKHTGMNPGSSKQVCSYLYETLNMKPILRDRKQKDGAKKKTVTSDDDAIRELVGLHPEQKDTLLKILEYRKRQHDLSTYINAVDEGGVWYYSINISGTVSGRNSVGLTLDRKGIPAQGIPGGKSPGSQNLRKMIGVKGLLCFEGDASQAEARDVAWVAGEEILFNAFTRKEDVHKKTGSFLFGIPIDQITKYQRELAKRIKHASNYWIGARKLVLVVREYFPDYPFNEKMAKYFLAKLQEAYPATYAWGCQIRDDIMERKIRVFRSHYGRRLFLLGPENMEMVRAAISFIPQADVGDHTTLANPRVQRRLKELDIDPSKNYVNNLVQDSICGICEERNVPSIMQIVKEEMQREIPNLYYKGTPLSIPCEFAVGPNWGEMKEVK
jgi:DNA polymerase-1